jgi:hypothetical protein
MAIQNDKLIQIENNVMSNLSKHKNIVGFIDFGNA